MFSTSGNFFFCFKCSSRNCKAALWKRSQLHNLCFFFNWMPHLLVSFCTTLSKTSLECISDQRYFLKLVIGGFVGDTWPQLSWLQLSWSYVLEWELVWSVNSIDSPNYCSISAKRRLYNNQVSKVKCLRFRKRQKDYTNIPELQRESSVVKIGISIGVY